LNTSSSTACTSAALKKTPMPLSADLLTLPAAELAAHSRIRLTILPDPPALFEHFARTLAEEIKANNQAERLTRLILPVGPVGQYPRLVEICNAEGISWRSVHTFNMDEYCDWQGRLVPESHPLSFRGFMRQQVFERLDPELRPSAKQTHFPDPLHLDAIRDAIAAVGGIDTCYGGVGYYGHIAFNEPAISRWYKVSAAEFKASLPRLVPLAPDTVVMNSIRNTGGNPGSFPPMGVTLGMADILAARRIRIYCPGGAWQRYAVRMALFSAETVEYPVTLLQAHPDYELILDEATAQPPQVGLV
jgi:glucosamine-6-phosphate deaminase